MNNIMGLIMIKKSDFFILRKNKKLMKDKILDYGTLLKDGISNYEKAGRNVIVAAVCGIIVSRFIFLSVMCFIAAMYFLVKILMYTKYGAINKILNKLSKDFTYKGIFDKEKIQYMINDYKKQYGELDTEYKDLMKIVNSYEKFVIKLECILRDLEIEGKRAKREQELIKNYNSQFFKGLHDEMLKKSKENKARVSIIEGYRKNKNTMIYTDNEGSYKEAEKVVDFFDEKDEKDNAVILKNKSDNKNITVYLYKRNCKLKDNAL